MAGIVRIAAMGALAGAWCAASAEPPLAVLSINKEWIAQIRQHPLATAEVNDPVYKHTQRYQGIWLRDALKLLGSGGRPESDLYVRFRCRDGYSPIIPLSRALAGKALIAIRDLNASPGEDWQPVRTSDGERSTPAPSYLVWATPADGPEEYPWPYQMIAIELVTGSEALANVVPDASKRGYELFVTHCLNCHSINGVGGTFGPDLNSPCSVTEYWNPGFLSRFIASAASIRAGTRMPDFRSLTGKDIQAIVGYLRDVAGHKKPGSVCPQQP